MPNGDTKQPQYQPQPTQEAFLKNFRTVVSEKTKSNVLDAVPDDQLWENLKIAAPEVVNKVLPGGVPADPIQQARQSIKSPEQLRQAEFAPPKTGGAYPTMSPTGYATSPNIPASTQAQMLSGVAGGEALGISKTYAALPKIYKMLAMAGTGAATTGASTLATGGGLKKAGKEAVIGGGVGLATEGIVIPAVSRLMNLIRVDPKRLAEMSELLETSDKLRNEPQKAAEFIRGPMLDSLYPKIQGNVPILPSAKIAGEAEKLGFMEPLPGEAAKVVARGKQADTEARKALSQAVAALRQHGNRFGRDPAFFQAADALKDMLRQYQAGQLEKGIPWRQAQQVYSAMGRAIARGEGNLPDKTYHALTGIQDMIDDSMRAAARAEGKEGQFLQARDVARQFNEDFMHRDSPLRELMNAQPGEHSKVLKAALADPDKRIGITKALLRWEKLTGRDLGSKDIDRLVTKWRDPTELNRRIQEAARLEQLIATQGKAAGTESFSASEAKATRKVAGKAALKIGVTGAGAGAAYGLGRYIYESLAPSPAKIQPR